MKQFFVSILAVVSFAAFGAREHVANIQIAHVDELVKGVTQLGELTGNPMIGFMASQAISTLPQIKLFGPARDGESTLFATYADPEKLNAQLDKNDVAVAALYPIAQSKADFLATHPDATEKAGVITVKLDETTLAVVFSEDGKWVAWSDKKALSKRVIKEVKTASRAMNGDLAKVVVLPKGIKMFADSLADKMAKEKKDSPEYCKLAELEMWSKGISSVAIGVRVNEAGLDARVLAKITKGGTLETLCTKGIEDSAWNALDPKALSASLMAADVGGEYISWDKIESVLKKHGLDASFISVKEPVKNYGVYTLDIPALCEYITKDAEKIAGIDLAALMGDLGGLQSASTKGFKSPACGASFSIKGASPKTTPKARFESTLPEAKGKTLCKADVVSLYSTIKAILPAVLAKLESDERAAIEPLVKALPEEGAGAVASALWREQDAFRGIVRVSADEFKGITACVNVFMAYQMSQAMQGVETIENEE